MTRPADDHYPSLHKVHKPWIGLALPPFAWAAQVAAGYVLVPLLCRAGAGPLPIQVISLVAIVLAGAGLVLSWRELRRHGGSRPFSAGGGLADRPRFMALGGVLLGSFLLALIVLQAIPPFLVPPCE